MECESEVLTLLKQMNKRLERLVGHVQSIDLKVQNFDTRFDEQERSFKQTIKQAIEESEQRINARLDQHEQLLQQLSEEIAIASRKVREATERHTRNFDRSFQKNLLIKRELARLNREIQSSYY
ncbi:hypothetical protein M3212_08915 [Alkalihalobacillus oceani]|uniref:hypothetical protein n=1 Tax=Halalkalibacter oceani TaxID=1653776 RepID=UPI00203B9750|nr:hypothetical protein [Halalkalibacter oceani]MCM3760909.1 hypothetical protein [Halalkalibacter oceani]